MDWLIPVSIGVAVLAFVVLVVFLCIALFSLRRTLHSSNELLVETRWVVDDLQEKIHSFDPLFRTVDKVGGRVEKRLSRAAEEFDEHDSTRSWVTDAVEFAVLGLSLWQKIKDRR